jgi:hypothetical protein
LDVRTASWGRTEWRMSPEQFESALTDLRDWATDASSDPDETN